MGFKTIETQEELDAIIKDRLERNTEKIRSEFADYESLKTQLSESKDKLDQANKKLLENDTTIADLNAKITAHETNSVKMRIAVEKGLPLKMVDRLQGTTEEEIAKDCDLIKGLFNSTKPTAPAADPESNQNGADNSIQQLLNSLTA